MNGGKQMIIGICEDQNEIRADLKKKIEQDTNSSSFEIYEFCSGEEMLNSAVHFDLVFLDIELQGKISGLDVAQELQRKLFDLIIVFVSGYTQYVSSAFRLNTFHFLVKPIDEKLFQEEFARCIKHYRASHDIFQVFQNGEVIELKMKEIIYIESDKRKIIIHLRGGKQYEMYGKISEQEEKLSVHHFIRIHKSYLVNCRYIKKMSDEIVWLTNVGKDELTSLPLSRRCKAKAKEQYHAYFFEV